MPSRARAASACGGTGHRVAERDTAARHIRSPRTGATRCDGGGGGITDPPPSPPPPPAAGTVVIHLTPDLKFSPADVTVAPGTRVRWVNDVAMGHTITPDNAAQAGAWPSTSISAAGAIYETVMQTAGDFPYHCNPHSGVMRGTIHVR